MHHTIIFESDSQPNPGMPGHCARLKVSFEIECTDPDGDTARGVVASVQNLEDGTWIDFLILSADERKMIQSWIDAIALEHSESVYERWVDFIRDVKKDD